MLGGQRTELGHAGLRPPLRDVVVAATFDREQVPLDECDAEVAIQHR